MTHRKKITSQSGFMSVEAIATTLFYLIMVAVIAAISAQVISGGKIASTLNSLGALRVNIQYVGANLSDYSSVASTTGFNLHAYVPSIADAGSDTYKLPTGHTISTFPAVKDDINPDTGAKIVLPTGATSDPSFFTMEILDLSPGDCRKVAYYAIGGNYGLATIDSSSVIKGVTDVESDCGTTGTVNLHLTSR